MIRPITQESIDLIQHFEGFYSKPYLCPANVPTIGIGTTAYPDGRKVKLSDPAITEAMAEEYLMHELNEKADTVHLFLQKNSILLSEQQYSALVSFAYNCGCGPIIDKGRSLHEAILSDSIVKISNALLLYNKATKKIGPFKRVVELPGLTRRRKAEQYLFLTGQNKFYA